MASFNGLVTKPTEPRRRPRALAALLTGAALVVASVITGAIASPGRIIALPGSAESTVVTVDPTRVLDTRYDVGLAGPFTSLVSRKLQITGSIETYVEATETRTSKVVVPDGATGVMMNITAVSPSGTGYLSVRPGNASGVPATAGLNFDPGDIIPNVLTVALPTTGAQQGTIDLYYGSPAAGERLDVVIDIVGYTTNAGLADLVTRVLALEAAGVQGPPGPEGPEGPPGSAAARVIWVSDSGGDYLSVSDALDAIGTELPGASAEDPYVIKIGPGSYTETAPVVLEDFVDIEGSGRGVTTIICATCSGPVGPESATLAATGAVTSEVRDLSIENTGGGEFSIGIWTDLATDTLSVTRVDSTATGGVFGLGVFNFSSSPRLVDMSASAHDNTESYGVLNNNGSQPTMTNVTVAAWNSAEGYGVLNRESSPAMRTLSVRVEANGVNFGVSNENATAPLLSAATIVMSGTECYGVTNDASSPELENVGIFMQCTNELYGVRNTNSSAARLHDVEIIAQTPGVDPYAIFVGIDNDASSPTIDSVIVTSDVGEENYGVRNTASTPQISNLTADIAGGTTSNIGVSNEASTAATIHTSSLLTRLFGALAIVNDATSTALVTDSTLEGTVIEGGLTCIGVHTPTGLELGRDCVSRPGPARVLWVAESGGDFTLLSEALAAIGTFLPAATVDTPYVIKIAPGIYTETETVRLKDHVDIEGSGQSTTTITCPCGDADWGSGSAALIASEPNTAEIRDLTVENTGGDSASTAIVLEGATSVVRPGPTLTHVTAIASGGAQQNVGLSVTWTFSPALTHVTATATGGRYAYGVSVVTGSPMLTHVSGSASGGTDWNVGVYTASSAGGGPWSVAILTHVTGTAAGGDRASGVANTLSSPIMTDVSASATDAATNTGVYNHYASPIMTNVTATATGPQLNFGVHNENQTLARMDQVTASASGGAGNQGIYNTVVSVAIVRDSVLVGGDNAIKNFNDSTAMVANTMLDGGVDGGGFTCVGVYDELFDPLGPTCVTPEP